jgi:hypothetical protein
MTFADPRRPYEKKGFGRSRHTSSRLIVESKTYTRADWVGMATFATLIKTLHNASLTRVIAIYLRLTHGVRYTAFYESLIDEFLARSPLTRACCSSVTNHFRDFLLSVDATDHMEVEQLPRLPYRLDPPRWLLVQMALQFDSFFDALTTYLLAKYPAATNLKSAIDYQRNIVILPSYNKSVGKTFRTDCDWPRYCEQAWGRTGSETLEEPARTPGAKIRITDQACGEQSYFVHPLDWGSGDRQDRWLQWIHQTVLHRNSAAKNNFQQLRLLVNEQIAAAAQS